MKQINEYINEAFRLRDDTKLNYDNYRKNDYDDDDDMRTLHGATIFLYNGNKKQFKIPNKLWYVFKDKYCHNGYKIECYSELALNIAYHHDDYEDFGPQDIEYATNSLKDAILWIFNNVFVDPKNHKKVKEIFDNIQEYSYEEFEDELAKYVDTLEFFKRVSMNLHIIYDIFMGDTEPYELSSDENNKDYLFDTFDDFKRFCGDAWE